MWFGEEFFQENKEKTGKEECHMLFWDFERLLGSQKSPRFSPHRIFSQLMMRLPSSGVIIQKEYGEKP